MSRFFRILRRTLWVSLTILSLLLFLATVVAWAASHQDERVIQFINRANHPQISWYHAPVIETSIVSGTLHLSQHVAIVSGSDDKGWYFFRLGLLSGRTSPYVLPHFHGGSRTDVYEFDCWTPLWFLAILFAILPALKLRAILRARKQTRGFEVITKPESAEC